MKKKEYTLWEIWTGKAEKEEKERNRPEHLIRNPLDLHPGDFVNSSFRDKGMEFTVAEICEKKREIAGIKLLFCDYVLQCGSEIRIMRLIPKEKPDPDNVIKNDVLWLKPFWECEFTDELEAALMQEYFNENDDNGKLLHSYESMRKKVKGRYPGYDITMRVAKLGESNLDYKKAIYYDFWRDADPEMDDEIPGQPVILFVESVEPDGYIQMFQGQPISEHEISVIKR